MTQQDEIARDTPLAPARLNHRELRPLLADDQSGTQPALVEVFDNGAEVFDGCCHDALILTRRSLRDYMDEVRCRE